MVARMQRHGDITVFHPTMSLICQLSDWVGRHQGTSVRAVSSDLGRHLVGEMLDAGFCVVDGTLKPDEAMDALAEAVDCVGAGRVAVYTEVEHRKLELFTRERGALYLLGPMEPAEWDAYFPGPPPQAIREVG